MASTPPTNSGCSRLGSSCCRMAQTRSAMGMWIQSVLSALLSSCVSSYHHHMYAYTWTTFPSPKHCSLLGRSQDYRERCAIVLWSTPHHHVVQVESRCAHAFPRLFHTKRCRASSCASQRSPLPCLGEPWSSTNVFAVTISVYNTLSFDNKRKRWRKCRSV